jgi:hypothetical protein
MRTDTVRLPDPDKKKSAPVDKTKRNRPRTPWSDRRDFTSKPDGEISQEENEPTSEVRRSVTNTDEQNKVTNAQDGNEPLDERETEGV